MSTKVEISAQSEELKKIITAQQERLEFFEEQTRLLAIRNGLMQQNIKKIKDDNFALQKLLEFRGKTYTSLKNKIDEVQKSLSEEKLSTQVLETEIAERENIIAVLKEDIQVLYNEFQNNKAEIKNISEVLNETRNNLRRKNYEIKKVQNILDKKSAEVENLNLKSQQQDKKLKMLYNSNVRLGQENQQQKSALKLKQNSLNYATEELADKNFEIGRLENELQTLGGRLKDQDDYIQILESQSEHSDNQIFANEDLHQLLVQMIEETTFELDIMSPWINSTVLNSDLLERISSLLYKGITVKIVYGTSSTDKKSAKTDKFVRRLHNHYFRDFENFKTKKIETHGKIFICDEKYYVLTSMNPLSNDGSLWEEIGEKSTNIKNLKEYRKKYFNF